MGEIKDNIPFFDIRVCIFMQSCSQGSGQLNLDLIFKNNLVIPW